MKQGVLQLMRKAGLATKRNSLDGFSLVEIVLAVSIFSLFVGALTAAIIYGEQSTALAGARARAVFLAEEGLEAVKNINEANYSLLTAGLYGLTTNGNQWDLSGTSDTTGEFTRQISITNLDSNNKNVTSTVTWQQTPQRTGTVSLTTRFTNWLVIQAESVVFNTSNAQLNSRQLLDLTIQNPTTSDLVVDKIKLVWDSGMDVREARINNIPVWSRSGPGTPLGDQPSGTVLDIVNTTIPAESQPIDLYFAFDSTAGGSGQFTLTLILIDGSEKSVSFFAS